MSGYRRVNYYELCRLCTSSEGTKMHIFREEGRRRQLPTKIQVCLPLQVCEDDSLPKIICNHCADKLESFYDFRETCVNAENMLEGYFSSLRDSEEFIRDGKVYVKDDTPEKKLTHSETPSQIKVATVTPVPIVQPVTVETLPAIQIVRPPDSEPSFKDHIIVDQPISVDDSMIESRFTYQTCNSSSESNNNSSNVNNNNNNHNENSANTSVFIAHSEDGTQTDFTDEHKTMKMKDDSNQQLSVTSSEGGDNNSSVQLQQAMTLQQNQEMLVQLGFSKDKDGAAAALFRTEDALQRSSIAQIGEFLKMKTVMMVESFTDPDGLHIAMCDTCGQELSSAEELTTHVLTCKSSSDSHTNNGFNEKSNHTSCECDVCGKPFKRKEHLFQHRKLHTGERPYTCSICLKSFSRKEHLVRHSVSHTGQKMHSCDLCGKSFSRKDNLHKHRKTHGIAGPYICDVCGKSFVVRHYYQLHKETVHSSCDSTNENLPYRCDICNKGFNVKQYLTTHRARHRNKNSAATNVPTSTSDQTTPVETNASTVNVASILPPNVLHSGSATSSAVPSPVFQVTSTTGTTFLCTPGAITTNQLLESYRRLHQTS